MTNQEKDLSATLHQKLGVVESRGPVELNCFTDARFDGKHVILKADGGFAPQQIVLTPSSFRNLVCFAESIGWQCD